jgi:hypothetical protein
MQLKDGQTAPSERSISIVVAHSTVRFAHIAPVLLQSEQPIYHWSGSTFMQRYDAPLYEEWVVMTQERLHQSEKITTRFGAAYVLSDHDCRENRRETPE